MAEQQTNKDGSSTFVERKVLSGEQRARRLVIAVACVTVLILGIIAITTRYQKPIRTYFAGLNKQDTDKMCEAFPEWLVNAEVTADTMQISDMCASMISAMRLQHGNYPRVKVSVSRKTELEDSYLQQIEAGILEKYFHEVTVSKGYELNLAVTYVETSSSSSTMYQTARVYCINGHWYLLDIVSQEP